MEARTRRNRISLIDDKTGTYMSLYYGFNFFKPLLPILITYVDPLFDIIVSKIIQLHSAYSSDSRLKNSILSITNWKIA